jgi:hypothetical protein
MRPRTLAMRHRHDPDGDTPCGVVGTAGQSSLFFVFLPLLQGIARPVPLRRGLRRLGKIVQLFHVDVSFSGVTGAAYKFAAAFDPL